MKVKNKIKFNYEHCETFKGDDQLEDHCYIDYEDDRDEYVLDDSDPRGFRIVNKKSA